MEMRLLNILRRQWIGSQEDMRAKRLEQLKPSVRLLCYERGTLYYHNWSCDTPKIMALSFQIALELILLLVFSFSFNFRRGVGWSSRIR